MLKEQYYDNDNDSVSLSILIGNGVEQLKSILTVNDPSNEDEKTKYIHLFSFFFVTYLILK